MKRVSEWDNIIRMGNGKDIQVYGWGAILRGQPITYNQYKFLKIRFLGCCAENVYKLLRILWFSGYKLQEVVKMKNGFKFERNVTSSDAYEAIIKKIPALEFDDDSEFEEWVARKRVDFKDLKNTALDKCPEEFLED